MGEIINFQEYKDRIAAAERKEISEDIDRLREELREMMGDMETYGEAMWPETFLDQLPYLIRIDEALDGYDQEHRDSSDFLDGE